MKKVLVLFVAAALVSSIAMAAGARIGGAAMLNNGPGWSPEVTITDPLGQNQLTLADGSEICCLFGACGPIGGPYVGGTDSVTLNTYWNEDMPDPIPVGSWVVNWTLGIRIPNGNIIRLFEDEPVDFGDLSGLGFNPGDIITFCVAGILELPVQCTGGGTITQGHGVSFSEGGGTLPAGQSDPGSNDDTFTCV